MSTESRSKDDTTTQGNDSASAVPSGFILKLYQMVNGAPDEVISVSENVWKLPSHLCQRGSPIFLQGIACLIDLVNGYPKRCRDGRIT